MSDEIKFITPPSAANNEQFDEVIGIILRHRSHALRCVNEEAIASAWSVGGYVSAKLKSEEWGSKVVAQLAEYIRSRYPELKGYSRRTIYNMVALYDEYSSIDFLSTVGKYLPDKMVQPVGAQIELPATSFVQPVGAQMPGILTKTTLSNLYQILFHCKSHEEKLFYILYANREHLSKRELERCIANNTFGAIVGSKQNMSKGLVETYPQAPVMFKDTLFVDFLGLPRKHSENRLKRGILQHMKQFILELGKDFLFVDEEYSLTVGASTFKADLLFFHRGLQALVAVELKKGKFHPRDLGQLEFYLEALDRDVRRSNENPSVGIILCPEADSAVVEYAMSRSMSPAMVAQYKRILIPQERMQERLSEYCSMLGKEPCSTPNA